MKVGAEHPPMELAGNKGTKSLRDCRPASSRLRLPGRTQSLGAVPQGLRALLPPNSIRGVMPRGSLGG
jgi:hypothetical protein